MSLPDFVTYASSSNLASDEIHTIELLIEEVRSKFDPQPWDKRWAADQARKKPDYVPAFAREHVAQAARELSLITRLKFPFDWDNGKYITNISALRFFPNITDLDLGGQNVPDIEPLRYLPNLEKLCLSGNPIEDISALRACPRLTTLFLPSEEFPDLAPLADCLGLEDLSTSGRICDLSVLESFPKLSRLSLSPESLPAFRQLKELSSVVCLEFVGWKLFDSLNDLPTMPKLRRLGGARVESLEGIQQFSNLQDISCGGTFDSLEPLWGARELTHLQIQESALRSLESVSRIYPLRWFGMKTKFVGFDLEPLKALPALHDVSIWAEEESYTYHPGQAALREELSSWDTEFLSPEARYTPSLEMEVLYQNAALYHDTDTGFGVTEADNNEEMLVSEMNWMRRKLAGILEAEFGELGKSFSSATGWAKCRSMPAGTDCEELMESFPRLVLGIQRVLCHSKNDWIVHFMADMAETENWFTAWIHPNKIVVCEEYADRVRRLLSPW